MPGTCDRRANAEKILELIVGNTRVTAAALELTEDGVIARLSGAALRDVLDATFGGPASVQVWGQDIGARLMTVTEIRMHGATSTVTLEDTGTAMAVH
ncbi:hypothetical protein ACFSUD_03785 [Sulfitobacter aestuarii]|uniref:Uncharacterized protein n=1 Tax=Sulfitobacter aestuarii TaxID=2161676 RepID=A0ABW5TZV5_9RHOB